eukprot:5308595-Alexandrium_andersonii.AAC.1
MSASLVGSEMCIRDRGWLVFRGHALAERHWQRAEDRILSVAVCFPCSARPGSPQREAVGSAAP